jgi:hypothetical protein
MVRTPRRRTDLPFLRRIAACRKRYRQFLGGYRASLCNWQKEDLARLRLPTTLPASPYNRMAASIGLGAAFRRNRWPHCLGFRIGPPRGS